MRSRNGWVRRSASTLALAVVLMAVAACGSDGGGASGETTTAPSTAATTTRPATTTTQPAATTSTAGGSTTTTPTFTGSGRAEFCGHVNELEHRQGLTGKLFGPDATPATVEEGFREVEEIYGHLIAAASSEIKGDLETTRAYLMKARDVYAANGYDLQKVMAALDDPAVAAALNFADAPEYVTASDRVDAYVEQVCGAKPE